jgi:hypothetical protein
MRWIWTIVVAVLAALAIAGGSFWAGMRYARAQIPAAALQFSEGGLAGPGGQFPSGGQAPELRGTRQADRSGASQPAGGVIGTIQSIEGQVLTVATDGETIRVEATGTTLIEKTMPVGVDDLEIDERILVMGRENDDGSITARSIQPVGARRFGGQVGGEE